MFFDETQKKVIGFTFLMNELEILTPFGASERKKISPYKDDDRNSLIEDLNDLENLINKLIGSKKISQKLDQILYKYKDIRKIVKRCQDLKTLDEVELFQIKNFSLISEDLIELYKKIGIDIDKICFRSLEPILTLLDPEHKKLSPFHIYNVYSKELLYIRESKKKLEENIAKEENEQILDILKSERQKYVLLEEEEELRIRRWLTEQIQKNIFVLEDNIYSIGWLDFIHAKAKLAIKFHGIKPQISNDLEIILQDCVNPYIQDILSIKEKTFTPISITLKVGVTVITGANMGGKTVSLNTFALNVFLGQLGFFVYAKEAKIPLLDFIYIISDDMQDVSRGLSTFGAEIIKIEEIIGVIRNHKGIILMDEIARGTNPKEGFILVKAISEYLQKQNVITVIATHYDGISTKKTIHYQVIGLKNVNFDSLKSQIVKSREKSVEIIQDFIDYRLEQVSYNSKVPKDALNIAILLGLEMEIVENAKKMYF